MGVKGVKKGMWKSQPKDGDCSSWISNSSVFISGVLEGVSHSYSENLIVD